MTGNPSKLSVPVVVRITHRADGGRMLCVWEAHERTAGATEAQAGSTGKLLYPHPE